MSMTAHVEFVWLYGTVFCGIQNPENSYEKDFLVIAATLADHVELKNCFSELMTAGVRSTTIRLVSFQYCHQVQ